MSELEQMVVACDDRIGPGSKCAFENSVIGFIVAHEIHRLGGMDQDGSPRASTSSAVTEKLSAEM